MTDVTLKFTGNIYKRMGTFGMGFSFEGANLSALLNELLARYNLQDLLIDDRGQIRPYARVLVNGGHSCALTFMRPCEPSPAARR